MEKLDILLIDRGDISAKEVYFKTIDIYNDGGKYKISKGELYDTILVSPSLIFEGCEIISTKWRSLYTHEVKDVIRFTYLRKEDDIIRFNRVKKLEDILNSK